MPNLYLYGNGLRYTFPSYMEYYISRHDIFNVGSMRKFAAISVAVWRIKHDGKI